MSTPQHLSPDGKFFWDGARWVPVKSEPATALVQSEQVSLPASTNPIVRSGRWLSADQKFWWDGAQWIPYRRITWNSIHIHSNPPEDRATLSRNLGIWCAGLGILGLVGVRLGAFSIMAAVAGPVSIYYGLSFFRLKGQGDGRPTGSGKAWAGLILSLIGLCGFLLAIVGFFAARS